MNTPDERGERSTIRVALLSPGDMGAELARHLVGRGVDVVSPLGERSARTRELANAAGIRDVGRVEDAVGDADLVVSLVPPASALEVAQTVAAALRASGSHPLYVDANSVSPGTAVDIATIVTSAGARFVDAAIVGPTPRSIATTRIYAAGPGLDELVRFGAAAGLVVRPLGTEIGRASALKMGYSSLSKGLPAISLGLLLAASRLGVLDELIAELQVSQPDAYRRLSSLGRVPAVAGRWAGEADEIAKTYAGVGLPSRLFEGAADIYRLAAEAPAADDRDRSVAELIGALTADRST